MEQTPSDGSSQPSTFTYTTSYFPSIQSPTVAANASRFEGTSTTPRQNIGASSHSTSHQFYLPSASASTSFEPCTAPANQLPAPPWRGTPAFRPFNSNTPILLEPFPTSLGNAPCGLATSSASISSTSAPSRSSTHGWPSCHVKPSQAIGTNPNSSLFYDVQPQSHSLPPHCAVPPVVAAPSHLPMGGEIFGGNTLNTILNPTDIPIYDHLFLQWLQARRGWIIRQGRGDPFLVGSSLLAQNFDKWLRQWWPLFHFLRLSAPGTNPSGWIGIFDFWFITIPDEHISSPSLPQTVPDITSTAPTASDQAPDVAIASPASARLATGSMKHYWNETSTLTVQQIQHACTVAGGDPSAIQRLAVVFSPGSVVTRDALKVGQKPRVGHHGYQEFSVLLDGRWYCLLCRMTGERSWKNQKDILSHVWNDHCDPPSLS